MSADRKLIAEAEAFGGRVYLLDGELKLAFRGQPPSDLIARLRELRADIARELAPPVATEAPAAPQRLDWWNAPVEGWREGRLVLRNIVSGKETVIHLPMKRTRH